MSKAHSKRSPHGFTLVELMIVVAIIGILASIAVPSFLRFQIRTKVAERHLVLHRFKQALDDKITREGRLAPESSGGFIWGTYTPAWPPSPTKRPPDWKQVGWRELDMDVEGNCYYSYLFMAQSWATGNWGYIVAYGDLDSDGIFSQKNQQYQTDWTTGAFKLTWEWPPPGQDDPTTF